MVVSGCVQSVLSHGHQTHSMSRWGWDWTRFSHPGSQPWNWLQTSYEFCPACLWTCVECLVRLSPVKNRTQQGRGGFYIFQGTQNKIKELPILSYEPGLRGVRPQESPIVLSVCSTCPSHQRPSELSREADPEDGWFWSMVWFQVVPLCWWSLKMRW